MGVACSCDEANFALQEMGDQKRNEGEARWNRQQIPPMAAAFFLVLFLGSAYLRRASAPTGNAYRFLLQYTPEVSGYLFVATFLATVLADL